MESEHRSTRPRRLPWLLLSLLLLDLTLRLAVAFRPLEVIDGRTIPDDAYLSLQIARNIARGLGPWYTTAHTNGFQPLYVFLVVPAYWIFPQDLVAPIRAALVLLTLFDVASLWLLYRLVASFSSSRLTPVVAAIAWIANPYVIRTTLNGLETAVAAFFALWALTVFRRLHRQQTLPSNGQALRLGAVVGLAVLARIDSILLGAALAAVILLENRTRWRGALRRVAVMALAASVVCVPWLVYSYAYTGDLYPVSGQAVRLVDLDNLRTAAPGFGNWYGPLLRSGLTTIWSCNWPLLVAIAILGAMILPRQGRRPGYEPPRALLAAAGLFALFLLLAYVLHQYGRWYFDRYLYPFCFVLILGLAVLFEAAAARSRNGRLAQAAAIVVALVAAFALHGDRGRLTVAADRKNRLGYMQLGQWAARTFPPGSVLGGSQSGALAYFAPQLAVVNLDGVVNKDCYRSIVERRNQQYIVAAGIQQVIGWDINFSFIARHTAHWDPDLMAEPHPIPDLESWGNNWYAVAVRPNLR